MSPSKTWFCDGLVIFGLVFKILLHLGQEQLLFPPAYFDLHPITHDHSTTLSPYIFLYMKQVDEKRFMYPEEYGTCKQALIIKQRLRNHDGLIAYQAKNRITSLCLAINDFFQLYNRKPFKSWQAKPHFLGEILPYSDYTTGSLYCHHLDPLPKPFFHPLYGFHQPVFINRFHQVIHGAELQEPATGIHYVP